MNHCAGGPATDSFDGLGAIVDWVEKGRRRRASRRRRAQARVIPGRTRPLCPFPASARYTGSRQSRGRRELRLRGEVSVGHLLLVAMLVWTQQVAQGPAPAESPVRGLYNWIHSPGDAERSFAFYRDVFGIELAQSPFAGTASADAPPEPIRPLSQAGSDALVWDLTNTHGPDSAPS